MCKLLNCTSCGDIIMLQHYIRTCICEASCGAYKADRITAVIYGKYARVLGIENSELIASLKTKIIPFNTYFKWFPIISSLEHNVINVANIDELHCMVTATEPEPPQTRPQRHRVKCLGCNDIIESKFNHDFVRCSCGLVAVDGGGGDPDLFSILGWPEKYQKIESEIA
jgi:hypothetical protein